MNLAVGLFPQSDCMKPIRQILNEAISDVPEMGPEDVRRELYNSLFLKHLHRIHHKRIFDAHERKPLSKAVLDQGTAHYNTSVSYAHEALELHQLLKSIDPSYSVKDHWDLESAAKAAASKTHFGAQTI